jgi:hypothetical protein
MYCAIMGEVKDRCITIHKAHQALMARQFPYPEYQGFEFCILQLRLVTELIAFAIAIAHEKVAATRSARWHKKYNAGDIMSSMGKYHADFYPAPVARRPGPHGPRHHLEAIKEGYLTKGELIRLYNRCGELLHRGYLRDFLGASADRGYPIELIPESLQKIERLLDNHIIKMASDNELALIVMAEGPEKKVQWYLLGKR